MINLVDNILPTVVTVASADLEKTISDLSITTVMGGSAALIVLVGLAMLLINRRPKLKPLLFSLILLVVLGTTLTISGATVFLNTRSATGGPVHWHADFEFWACDNQLELRNPRGALSNKIGTPTLHEHGDKRIHLEGVPVTLPHDDSLGKFMDVIDGEVGNNSLVVPLNDQGYFENNTADNSPPPAPEDVLPYVVTGKDGAYARFISGQNCGGKPAEVQVFAYRYDATAKTYHQTKVEHPETFEISHYSDVPPGDCVIVEFAPAKARTDKLCLQYGIRDKDRCQQFGVKPEEEKICEIREMR